MDVTIQGNKTRLRSWNNIIRARHGARIMIAEGAIDNYVDTHL